MSRSKANPAASAAHHQSYRDDDDEDADSLSHASSTSQVGVKRTPNYAQPTQANQLPEYANAEAEAIRASFSTGNYRLISHLPTDLKPHHVSEATANRIDDNITSSYFVAPHGSYRKFGQKDALFSTFDYVPEEYSLANQLSTMVRKDHEQRRLAVNPLPFLYSTPRPLLINGLAGKASPEENERYAGQDIYLSAEEQTRRMQYLDSQSILHGPFVPTGGARSIGDDKIIRLKLPDIVSKLMRELDADWGDTSFQIYCDPEDLIIVQFDQATIDNPKGLLAYMNMFVKTNKVISEYALSKLVELWNHTSSPSDNFLYYAFRPPWVRRRAEESMFVLHPEMSKPGGKYIDEEKERRKELKEGEKQEQLRLTEGSAQNTARSHSEQQQQPTYPLSQRSIQQQSSASSHQQSSSLAGNPPSIPASTMQAHAQHQQFQLSAEDRQQMERMLAMEAEGRR